VKPWLLLGLLLTACSDESTRWRGEFIAGCMQGGTSTALCQCIFEKLAVRYPAEALQALHQGQRLPDSTMAAVAESAMACPGA
jgi:hypothetical protein